ncbi:hypothetical protein Pyn_32356 [Prunus yedoensis var. nudiflora]|uniref:Uncharacterized protein n=1 Tax=Prunus yedoensis var. nudiflora TaxID=2094558 RepID=A0A314Y8D9_PRUYE|nr:hypothetical protein Pyn_32356 [Prunus yedoensis var. nudiflora]
MSRVTIAAWLKDGRRYCRNGDCLPCPGWRLLSMFGMAAPAVVEATALPLSLLHALSLSMAGATAPVLGWPRFLAEADLEGVARIRFQGRNVSDA